METNTQQIHHMKASFLLTANEDDGALVVVKDMACKDLLLNLILI